MMVSESHASTGAMLICMTCVTTGAMMTSEPGLQQEAMFGSVVLPQPGSELIFMTPDTT